MKIQVQMLRYSISKVSPNPKKDPLLAWSLSSPSSSIGKLQEAPQEAASLVPCQKDVKKECPFESEFEGSLFSTAQKASKVWLKSMHSIVYVNSSLFYESKISLWVKCSLQERAL